MSAKVGGSQPAKREGGMVNINEVVVFYAPKQGRWVLRPLAAIGFSFGDRWAPTESEPTDDEIRAIFGDVKIRRGYHVTSEAAEVVIAARIAEVVGQTKGNGTEWPG